MKILYVEDSKGDIMLLEEVVAELKSDHILHAITNGKAAIEYLEDLKKLNKTTSINLIILDVNLPFVNGPQILSYIKKDDKLKTIPVIMFSDSVTQLDQCSKRDVLGCFPKSMDFDENVNNIKNIIKLAEKNGS